jgi:tetratricopeptide (TPR) repeat protein
VYETLAAPERLGAAIKIYRHLEREYSTDGTDKLQLVSNLAALYRRLEMQPAALEYERKFVTAFRRRMHRPSFADTVRAAARRYIGLRHLLGIRFVSTTPPDSATIRERGIAAALTGEAGLARERLSSGDALLDRKYLADLAVITHDDAVAAALYVSALAEDPYDPQILTAVLALHARTGATVVVEHFRQLGAFARARETLEREMHRAPLRPSLWHAQARLLRLQGNAEAADRSEQRAVSLAEAMRRRAHPVGRALSASVYHFLGKAEGLVHEVWAHRTPVDRGAGGALRPEQVLGNLTRDMKDGVLNTFYAVREYALAKFPERAADLFDYDYTYKVPKEDEPSGGLSAGLPSALAFLSVFLQRPIPQDIALSGILVADAHDVLTVRRVGEPDLKVQAAYHRNLRQLVLPAENSPELSATWKVPRDVCQEIVRFVSNVDDVVKLVWDDGVFVAA